MRASERGKQAHTQFSGMAILAPACHEAMRVYNHAPRTTFTAWDALQTWRRMTWSELTVFRRLHHVANITVAAKSREVVRQRRARENPRGGAAPMAVPRPH
jgi:hypothetical protein